MEQQMLSFAKGSYIINKRHQIHKVINTPDSVWMDDRQPGYMLLLVGCDEAFAFKKERKEVEKEFKPYRQQKEVVIEPTAPIYRQGDSVLHISSANVYEIELLPTECVLEHNHKPAYGYRMPDGRLCFRAQDEMEDGRFARIDKSMVALLMLADSVVEA